MNLYKNRRFFQKIIYLTTCWITQGWWRFFVVFPSTVSSIQDKFGTLHVVIRIFLDLLNENQNELDMLFHEIPNWLSTFLCKVLVTHAEKIVWVIHTTTCRSHSSGCPNKLRQRNSSSEYILQWNAVDLIRIYWSHSRENTIYLSENN